MSDKNKKLVEPNTKKGTAKWGAKPAIWLTFLAYIVSQLAVLLPYGFVYLVSGKEEARVFFEESVWASFFLIAFSAATMVSVIVLYLKKKKLKLASLGFRSLKPTDFGWLIIFGLGYLIISATVLSLASLVPGFDLNQEQELGFGVVAGWQLVAVFISLVLIPPLAEEIVFRGFFYRGLKNQFITKQVILAGVVMAGLTALLTTNPVTGLVIISMSLLAVFVAKKNIKLGSALFVSSIFGLVHGQWNVALDTFVLSMVMIALYEKTNNLWASVLLHGIKNFIAFMALFVIK